MKRILVYGMTDNPGGIETYLINLIERLHDRIGFDIVTDFKSIAHSELLEKYGCCIFMIPAKGKNPIKHLKSLRKILKEHSEYETIYFNLLDAGGAITELVPWLMKRKIVTHSHNGSTDKKWLHWFFRPILNVFTDKKVACSKVAALHMFGSDKEVTIIPNTINARTFTFDPIKRENMRKQLDLDGKTVICHVGRLSEQKNPFQMLRIFKRACEIQPDAVLVSVGDGELASQVYEYATKIDILDKVKFLGKRNDVADIFQAADVFFLPSLYEGLPIVCIEAQAAGLHCIISSEITSEVNLTEKVTFVSLESSDDCWAETLLKAANSSRYNAYNVISDAGYDIEGSKEKDTEILQILS